MRTISDIQADVRAALDKVKKLDATSEEGVQASAELKRLMQELDQAKAAEAAEQALVAEKIRKEEKKGNGFSFLRFIQGAASGHMDGLEAEMAAEGAKEYARNGFHSNPNGYVIPSAAFQRAASGQKAGTAADGGNLVITEQHYVDDVNERLTVRKMGATVLTDLVGNVDLPSVGGVTFSFVNEGVSGTAKKASVAKVTLTPTGIRGFMATTRDLIKQSSLNVEQILRDRIVAAEAACIDKAALAAIVSAATSAGTSFSFANLVAMETAINAANANRGKMGYILPSTDWGLAKTTVKASGIPSFILEGDDRINGYRADFSNQFAANTPIFGNFEDLYIGRWGGVEILVDPFTLGDTGEIKLQLFSYADVKVALAKSFSKLVIA